jgi:hypothetical protein
MFKVIWDKLVEILGDKFVILIIGALLAMYGFYHINKYFVTRSTLAQETDKIDCKIEEVKDKSDEKDLLIEYKVLEIEDNAVRQQQWALEDRLEEEAVQPTISQQSRIYEMKKRTEEIRRRKMEIQKELVQ